MNFQEKIPVFLAPMAGITDAPFRDLAGKFHITASVSEMISSEALIRSNKKTRSRLKNSNTSFKIIQIVGFDPQHMAESATINESLGADAIDINMGCPVRKIVSNNSGAALMKDEDLALKIVESIVKTVKIPVTIKMRLGWDNENINCFSLAKKFENAGIQMITVHCRTRKQMYGGKANWSSIKDLRNIIKIPYLCNGDIKTCEDAALALKESNATGVMIGRAAIGKPWLPGNIMNFLHGEALFTPSTKELFAIISEHFQHVLDFYGKERGIKIFRKHFCKYSANMSGASNFKNVINQAEDLNFIKSYVKDFFESQF
ncbi:MAG: tRNA dihydrouridine synthase DusB [Holosporaceae bacterium]|jgi:tRNA-dihydrouridine synthase B|nr:tRNA dihydrouridine synthase DusB [Holosporaceae bacterium]